MEEVEIEGRSAWSVAPKKLRKFKSTEGNKQNNKTWSIPHRECVNERKQWCIQ